ncbi:MAG: hypothetical protein WBW41_09595, partial [Verrucomicrobiia bacterium]
LGTDIYTNAGNVTSAAIDPTGTKILYRIANALYVDNIAPQSNLFSIETTGTAPIRNATGWSDDGRWLTFVSTTNLGAADDGTNRVYLLDFQTGTLSLIGLAGPGTGSWDALSDAPVISGSGQFVAYRSVVTNTVIGDNTAPPNVFFLDRVTGSNTVLTVGQAGSSPMLWVSRPVISDDGATVAFLDLGSGLVPGDLNRVQDAFGASLDINAVQLGPITVLPDGSVQVSMTGLAGQTYLIEYSTDLVNWFTLTEVTLTNGVGQFVDTSTNDFYQAVVLSQAQPQLGVPQFSAGGAAQVSVTGLAGQTYIIESSTNLVNWVPVYTNSGSFMFTDPDATDFPYRFYQAVLP